MIWSTRKGIAAVLSAGAVMIAGTVFAVLNATGASAGQAALAPAPTIVTATPAPYYALRCTTGTNAFGFNPPLTLVNQYTVIDRTTTYEQCDAPALPNIRSGYAYKRFGFMDDCRLMVQATGTANYDITWNTSQTSRFTGSRSASLSGTTLTVKFHGSITAGLYAGHRAIQVFTTDATELVACLNGRGRVPFTIARVSFVIYP